MVIQPLLVSSKPEIKSFGSLATLVLTTTFCFGDALMSLYLVAMIFWIGDRAACKPR